MSWMRLKIAAEGVEREHVREMLRLMGCDSIQGYLYAKPMSVAAVIRKYELEGARLDRPALSQA
jgi:EAL domain-containing protein (putative c-di-GMP-specific phosphodiesterase class I)